MIYSFKNFPVKLNGREILAASMDLSAQNYLIPSFQVGDRSTKNYTPAQGVEGSLKLNYYITGSDYVKSFINSDTGYISGNIGGLFFTSGVLSRYNFSCNPNANVAPSVEISFYEEIKGSFSPVNPPPNTGYAYLNCSDVVVDGLSAYSSETLSSINAISFSYSTKVSPYYFAKTGDQDQVVRLQADRIVCEERQLSTDIVCDSLTNNLLFSGSNLGVKINLTHPSLPNLDEYFLCSGKIISKGISSAEGGLAKSAISVIQHQTEEDPIISGLWSTRWPPEPLDLIRISGKNFTNTNSVWIYDRELNYSVVNDRLISGYLPVDAVTGPVYIYTNGGKVSSNLTVAPYSSASTWSALTLSAYTGVENDWIGVYGSGLLRVTGVYWNNPGGYVSGAFRSIDSGLLYAQVPTGASTYGEIKVYSQVYGSSPRLSDSYFSPTPVITGFNPSSGFSGDLITIYGKGFASVGTIKFNDIPTHQIVSPTAYSIGARVPTGDVFGYISVVNSSAGYSTSKFWPAIQISGIYPTSGRENDYILISGRSFQSGVMYQYDDGSFKVGFGDKVATGFRWVDKNTLSGYVPSGAQTSNIYIYASDGSTMYSPSAAFQRRYPAPTVSKMIPSAISGQQYFGYVEGRNLYNATMIQLSGLTAGVLPSSNTGTLFFITGQNLFNDSLGKRINVFNYTGFMGPTGTYGQIGKAFSGVFQLRVITPEGTGVGSTNFRLGVI